MTLVESKKKKALFLQRLITQIALSRVSVLNIRAEEIKDQKFNVILFRAAGKIAGVLNYAISLLGSCCTIIFFKSSEVKEEIRQAKKMVAALGLKDPEIKELVTPIENRQVNLVIFKKG